MLRKVLKALEMTPEGHSDPLKERGTPEIVKI
jgi:hypothetical protein